jgi:hypothetical protein
MPCKTGSLTLPVSEMNCPIATSQKGRIPVILIKETFGGEVAL